MSDLPDPKNIELADYAPALGAKIEESLERPTKSRVMTDTLRRRMKREAVSITADIHKDTHAQLKQLLEDIETVLQVRMPLCRVLDLVVRNGFEGARKALNVPKNPPKRPVQKTKRSVKAKEKSS